VAVVALVPGRENAAPRREMRKHRAADRLVIGVGTRHSTTDTTTLPSCRHVQSSPTSSTSARRRSRAPGPGMVHCHRRPIRDLRTRRKVFERDRLEALGEVLLERWAGAHSALPG
jgi:hypothetical protein